MVGCRLGVGTLGSKGSSRAWSIFSVAVLVNFPWEPAQARLYVGTDGAGIAPCVCLVASLVDGALVLLIYAVGVVVFRQRAWFMAPGHSGCALIAAAGFPISIAIEWITVYVTRLWAYSPNIRSYSDSGLGSHLSRRCWCSPSAFLIAAAWNRQHDGSKLLGSFDRKRVLHRRCEYFDVVSRSKLPG